jgi:hypothetical protein
VREVAFRVYPLVFRAVTRSSSKVFEEFLKTEINLLINPQSIEAKADPWINYLNENQRRCNV